MHGYVGMPRSAARAVSFGEFSLALMSNPVAQTMRVKFVTLSGTDLGIPPAGQWLHLPFLGELPARPRASQSQWVEVETRFTAPGSGSDSDTARSLGEKRYPVPRTV